MEEIVAVFDDAPMESVEIEFTEVDGVEVQTDVQTFTDRPVQTEIVGALTMPEQRPFFVAQKVDLPSTNVIERNEIGGDKIFDAKVLDSALYLLAQSGPYRVPLNKLCVDVPNEIRPLEDMECRAQRISSRKISWNAYQRLLEPIDITGGQFLLCSNPRDSRLTLTKISHDYQMRYSTPDVVRVYYDIETADLEKSGVPEHTSRTAFITMIGAVVVFPDGTSEKFCFLNQSLEYQFLRTSAEITVKDFPSEAQMCQEFIRFLTGMSQDETVVLCIAHNGSTNPRGEPYDLPFIAYRSLYNLTPIKKNYRDMYSATEGINWTGFAELPRLFFLDTIRSVGQHLQMAKKKIPSLGLDAVAKAIGAGV